MNRKRKLKKRRAGTFVGAWVPELTTAAVNQAVRAFGFRNRSRFLRAVLNAAVEELSGLSAAGEQEKRSMPGAGGTRALRSVHQR